MMQNYYILDSEHRVVPARDLVEWGRWFEDMDNRRVGWTRFDPGVEVSTVFLGIDHRHFGNGPPLLFETMVFGLNMDDEALLSRYASWDDAETGHKATVRRVQERLTMANADAS